MDEQRSHKVRKRLSRRALPSIPVVGAMVALGFFFYLPLALLVSRGVVLEGRLHLQPFLEIFQSRYLRRIMLFTVEQALLSTALSIVIGLPMAYLLSVYDFPGRRICARLQQFPSPSRQ